MHVKKAYIQAEVASGKTPMNPCTVFIERHSQHASGLVRCCGTWCSYEDSFCLPRRESTSLDLGEERSEVEVEKVLRIFTQEVLCISTH